MFSHPDIWRAIDRLANSSGYSPSGLAKQAGLDPTTFNKSKRVSPEGKPRWPSTESIAKILAVTGVTMSDFFALIDEGDAANDAGRKQQTIPVIGFAKAGKAGYFDEDGSPAGEGWDRVPFPEFDSNTSAENIYALEVSGDAMEPLYRGGDILVVSPGANIRRGDRVIVKTTSGEVMAKELTRQTANRVELSSLNAAHEDRSLRLEEISWMARIIWVSQ